MDQEIIDAGANNADEAMRALAKLREALNTLPFFGGAKVVWFKDCNFLGDDRTATSQGVTAALGDLAEFLKSFPWQGVRLLISAGKVDKRRTLYKTLGKLGEIETFSGWSVNDRDCWNGPAASPNSFPWRWRSSCCTSERATPSRCRTSRPSACAANRPGPSPWATPWVTATYPPCCGVLTRSSGR
jgi:hypothetical protein